MIYDDLRVVDLTSGIAGAYCAKLLTDLGADAVFANRVDDPLFTYLRTSQAYAPDPEPWLVAADLGPVGEGECCDGHKGHGSNGSRYQHLHGKLLVSYRDQPR